MKLIIQRVTKASVIFENGEFNEIGKGLLVYVGIHKDDTLIDIQKAVNKLLNLRIFENSIGKLDYNIIDKNYEILLISNFSIYGNLKKGNRPSFTNSADNIKANEMYDIFTKNLKERIENIKTGKFKTYMKVESINDGPLNFIFDTKEGD